MCGCRKGDYYRYLAEFKSGNEKKEAADQSLKAYQVCVVWCCEGVIYKFLVDACIKLQERDFIFCVAWVASNAIILGILSPYNGSIYWGKKLLLVETLIDLGTLFDQLFCAYDSLCFYFKALTIHVSLLRTYYCASSGWERLYLFIFFLSYTSIWSAREVHDMDTRSVLDMTLLDPLLGGLTYQGRDECGLKSVY